MILSHIKQFLYQFWSALICSKGPPCFQPPICSALPVFIKKWPQNVLIHNIQEHPRCFTQRGSVLTKLLVWKSIYLSKPVKSSKRLSECFKLDRFSCSYKIAIVEKEYDQEYDTTQYSIKNKWTLVISKNPESGATSQWIVRRKLDNGQMMVLKGKRVTYYDRYCSNPKIMWIESKMLLWKYATF